MKSPLSIWCNSYFPEAAQAEKRLLRAGVEPHRLVLVERDATPEYAQGAEAGGRIASLLDADIAFGQPDPETVMQSNRLRWIQINSAGYAAYDRDDLRQQLQERGCVMTNSSSVYDEPCAQHLLAMIMSLARNLPVALDAQRGSREWRMASLRANARLLNNQMVLILGFGAIARRLAELLAPLRMNLIGVRRRVRGNEPILVIEERDVDDHLHLADHVVNILPANDGTRNFLNAERLSRIKFGAMLYNIGRGTTIDQQALLASLRSGHLAAAYLDVTDPEPLPPEHGLWSAPNCFITPHIAGGHANEKERQVRHFLDNLRRFTNEEELVDRII